MYGRQANMNFGVAGIVAVTSIAGCNADHRMSLDEFLQLQRRTRAAEAEADTAEAQQAAGRMLDEKLGPYQIGPSDVLAVTLHGSDPALAQPPMQVRVDDAGEIELPLVGAVGVSGLRLQAAEDAIRSKYVPAIAQDLSVYVELVRPERVGVLVVGAVGTPGLVYLPRTERNLLYAIVRADGVTEIASGTATLRRLRDPSEEVTLDLTDPLQLQAAVALDPLQEGDIIQVHAARPNTVFVGGLVNRPAPQSYPQGAPLTVLQALAAAGGLRTDVLPKEGTLIRQMDDGKDVHVRLDLNRLATAQDPDIPLEPGDILWVPETARTRVLDFINRNIFLRAGATVTYSVTGVEFLNRRDLQTQRFGGGTLEDSFDPFGFLTRGSTLQTIANQPQP